MSHPQVSAPTGHQTTLVGSATADVERLAAFIAERRNGNPAPLTIAALSDALRDFRRAEDTRDAEHHERIARERREYLELRAQVDGATDDELAAMTTLDRPAELRRLAHGEMRRREWRERIWVEEARRFNPDGLLAPAEWNALSTEVAG